MSGEVQGKTSIAPELFEDSPIPILGKSYPTNAATDCLVKYPTLVLSVFLFVPLVLTVLSLGTDAPADTSPGSFSIRDHISARSYNALRDAATSWEGSMDKHIANARQVRKGTERSDIFTRIFVAYEIDVHAAWTYLQRMGLANATVDAQNNALSLFAKSNLEWIHSIEQHIQSNIAAYSNLCWKARFRGGPSDTEYDFKIWQRCTPPNTAMTWFYPGGLYNTTTPKHWTHDTTGALQEPLDRVRDLFFRSGNYRWFVDQAASPDYQIVSMLRSQFAVGVPFAESIGLSSDATLTTEEQIDHVDSLLSEVTQFLMGPVASEHPYIRVSFGGPRVEQALANTLVDGDTTRVFLCLIIVFPVLWYYFHSFVLSFLSSLMLAIVYPTGFFLYVVGASAGEVKLSMLTALSYLVTMVMTVNGMLIFFDTFRQSGFMPTSGRRNLLTVAQRMSYTYRKAGVGTTIAAIIVIICFAVNTSSKVPAVREFCGLACVFVVIAWVLLMTYFPAAVLFHHFHISRKRRNLQKQKEVLLERGLRIRDPQFMRFVSDIEKINNKHYSATFAELQVQATRAEMARRAQMEERRRQGYTDAAGDASFNDDGTLELMEESNTCASGCKVALHTVFGHQLFDEFSYKEQKSWKRAQEDRRREEEKAAAHGSALSMHVEKRHEERRWLGGAKNNVELSRQMALVATGESNPATAAASASANDNKDAPGARPLHDSEDSTAAGAAAGGGGGKRSPAVGDGVLAAAQRRAAWNDPDAELFPQSEMLDIKDENEFLNLFADAPGSGGGGATMGESGAAAAAEDGEEGGGENNNNHNNHLTVREQIVWRHAKNPDPLRGSVQDVVECGLINCDEMLAFDDSQLREHLVELGHTDFAQFSHEQTRAVAPLVGIRPVDAAHVGPERLHTMVGVALPLLYGKGRTLMALNLEQLRGYQKQKRNTGQRRRAQEMKREEEEAAAAAEEEEAERERKMAAMASQQQQNSHHHQPAAAAGGGGGGSLMQRRGKPRSPVEGDNKQLSKQQQQQQLIEEDLSDDDDDNNERQQQQQPQPQAEETENTEQQPSSPAEQLPAAPHQAQVNDDDDNDSEDADRKKKQQQHRVPPPPKRPPTKRPTAAEAPGLPSLVGRASNWWKDRRQHDREHCCGLLGRRINETPTERQQRILARSVKHEGYTWSERNFHGFFSEEIHHFRHFILVGYFLLLVFSIVYITVDGGLPFSHRAPAFLGFRPTERYDQLAFADSSTNCDYCSAYFAPLSSIPVPSEQAINTCAATTPDLPRYFLDVDACGQCGTKNECMDCAAVPDGSSALDSCGQCVNGSNPLKDECAMCLQSEKVSCSYCAEVLKTTDTTKTGPACAVPCDSSTCIHGTCDPWTGRCRCHASYAEGFFDGAKCDMCLDGWFSYPVCTSSCISSGLKDSCTCLNGRCNTCPFGYDGEGCKHRRPDLCDVEGGRIQGGSCVCNAGYAGGRCQGHANCSGHGVSLGSSPLTAAHVDLNGRCGCFGQWRGPRCEYCRCYNGGSCTDDGKCLCASGWAGDDCQECAASCRNRGGCPLSPYLPENYDYRTCRALFCSDADLASGMASDDGCRVCELSRGTNHPVCAYDGFTTPESCSGPADCAANPPEPNGTVTGCYRKPRYSRHHDCHCRGSWYGHSCTLCNKSDANDGKGITCREYDGVLLGCDLQPKRNGRYIFLDSCGTCGGASDSLLTCKGCDGVVGSTKVVDRCGVCGGFNDCVAQSSKRATKSSSVVSAQSTIYIAWGLREYPDEGASAAAAASLSNGGNPALRYYAHFDFSDSVVLQQLEWACGALLKETDFVKADQTRCFVKDWRAWVVKNGGKWPIRGKEATQSAYAFARSQGRFGEIAFSSLNNNESNFAVRWVQVEVRPVSLYDDDNRTHLEKQWELWMELKSRLDAGHSLKLGPSVVGSSAFVALFSLRAAQLGTVFTTLLGCALFGTLILTVTCSVFLSACCFFVMVGNVLFVLAMFRATGWDIGPIEQVSIALLMGVVSERVVHMVVAYMEYLHRLHSHWFAQEATRLNAVKNVMQRVGVSLGCSSLTLIVGTCIALSAELYVIRRIAIIVLIIVSTQLLYTLFVMPALLMVMGPVTSETSWRLRCFYFGVGCIFFLVVFVPPAASSAIALV